MQYELKKRCRICQEYKVLSEFHKKKSTPDGHRHECKKCVKIIQKKYKEKVGFKEKRKEYDKKRYEEKREQILERKKEYHQENKESILEKKAVYRKENDEQIREWRKNNPEKNSKGQANYRKKYPHIIAWRSVLHSTLNRLNTSKQDKTINLLGYSATQLKEHIESKFVKGMTWGNHGEWEIDHVYPVSKFPSDALISDVCSLDNLQPLWKEDNLRKGNKI